MIKMLWYQRYHIHTQKTAKYFALIGNSVFYAFLTLFGLGGYWYAKLLPSVAPQTPFSLIIAVILAFFLTRSRIRTFLQEGDLVFLLPLEEKMKTYFLHSFIYSYTISIIPLLVAGLALVPFYMHNPKANIALFLIGLLFLCLLKAWNMYLYWIIQKNREPSSLYLDYTTRYIFNTAFVFLYLQSSLLLVVIVLLGAGLTLFYQKINSKFIHWERLIAREQQMNISFYRFINLFMDVPHINKKVKARKLISLPISILVKSPFLYAYTLVFVRGNDYLTLYIRLILIGCIALYYIPGDYGKLGVLILFLFMTAFQTIPLWKHFYGKIIMDLYPLSLQKRKQSFLLLLFLLILIENTVFTIILAIWAKNIFIVGFFIGMIYIVLYIYLIVPKKLRI
ncbi:ABC transporter permease [Bacillus sp. 165]|uniref:ABC transporter permease n=1 Tax=Bacillus sp. 165 TaxID=1529117 RepID=UPI001ADA7E84|nr:ABC transporter permease [Bacillus sp. 165]MBO9128764.1 ABC transporter permease [Bacillus sp. 165]